MTKEKVIHAIRRNCIYCMGGQASLVEGCTAPNCSLFPFRMGKDPEPNKVRQLVAHLLQKEPTLA